MNGFTKWMLGIDQLPNDGGVLRLAWERPLPEWAWMLIILGCILIGFWSYQHLQASLRSRILLGSLRSIFLLLVSVLLAGPMLELPRVQVEPDWVVVLVDRSRSMQVRDVEEDGSSRDRQSRESALRKTLESSGESWRTPGENRRILWMGFGEGVIPLRETNTKEDDLPVDVGLPDAWRTRLAPALEEALRRTAGKPLAGVVVMSDGRTEAPPDRDLIRRLVASAAEVHAVALGSKVPIGDSAVSGIEAPRRAFSRDSVPVLVRIESRGRTGTVEAELVDDETGAVLDRQSIEIQNDEDVRDIVLTSPPSDPGEQSWSVRISSDEEDLVPENDQSSFKIELVDRPLRVLFIEAYPRWEYRYLKNLLIREPTIESSVMLLSADREFAQEGNAPLARLPRTAEEFAEFDLIILGDLPAGFLTERQQELIREQVARRGGGLMFIAGSRSLPSSWDGRPLAELFPFTGPLDLDRIEDSVVVVPTEQATRLGVLRLTLDGEERGWPTSLSDPSYEWSQLRWVQRIESARLKPTADILAEAVSVDDGERTPLVLGMRYGAGQVLYIATDEIWRWRYGRGESIPEQFWIQLVRLLGREAAEGDAAVQLRAEPSRSTLGRPVGVTVELVDVRGVPEIPETVRVDVIDENGRIAAELELIATSEAGWGNSWVPQQEGRHTLRIVDPMLIGQTGNSEVDVLVSRSNSETRNADADHDLLKSLVDMTSGSMHEPGAMDEILLPNRSFTTERPISERIWTSPLAFILLILLGSTEWMGRRLVRLD